MLEKSKEIPLLKIFSGGFVDNAYDNEGGYDKGSVFINGRIKGNSAIIREGFLKKSDVGSAPSVYATAIIPFKHKLVVTTSSNEIFISNEAKTAFTKLGDLNHSADSPKQPTIEVYSQYIIFLNGAKPQIYDSIAATLTDISSDYIPVTDFAPSMGRLNLDRNYVAGYATDKNKLFMSSTQLDTSEIFDFKGVSSNIKMFDTEIVGLENTINNLFVFTTNSIIQVTDDYVNAVKFDKLYEGSGLLNKQLVCNANNLIFFFTTDFKIKTINYIPGVPNPQIGDLSDVEGNSIQTTLNTALHSDQSASYMFYHDNDNVVWLHVRSATNTTANYPDIQIGYDLVHKTWIKDINKNYTASTFLDGEVYAGRYNLNDIVVDNTGLTDDGTNIIHNSKRKALTLGDSSVRKILKQLRLTGKMNLSTTFVLKIYVDGELAKTLYFDSHIINNLVAGEKTVNKMYDFSKVVSVGDLYLKGYIFEFEFENVGNSNTQFSLNGMFIKVQAMSNDQSIELIAK